MRTLSTSTTAKLFATGFTVGPIVDSLHNQCLLRYDVLPISLEWPTVLHQNQHVLGNIVSSSSTVDGYPYFFCSSWIVPPLLGFAYVVLGGLLPRLLELMQGSLQNKNQQGTYTTTATGMKPSPASPLSSSSSSQQLRTRAILAVTTTAMIIKLSEFLETHPGIIGGASEPISVSLLLMILACISQWALLDGSIAAFFLATITAIGGPLAELPFVGHGAWTYIDQAADYFPLHNFATPENNNLLLVQTIQALLGTSNYQDLALSSITGPCYFAVAMDAIALGRWFDASASTSSPSPAKQ